MVDALRRAQRVVSPEGSVVDLHPSPARATVGIGEAITGLVDEVDAPLRHAGAGVALAAVIDAGLFAIDRSLVFGFHTYGDTIEELQEFVRQHWREGRISDETVARTRAAARRHAASRPWVRERVYATRLRPCHFC